MEPVRPVRGSTTDAANAEPTAANLVPLLLNASDLPALAKRLVGYAEHVLGFSAAAVLWSLDWPAALEQQPARALTDDLHALVDAALATGIDVETHVGRALVVRAEAGEA
ncbi:MAG TPA: hypothetical protein VFO79_03040, partial [Xanthomonadales bacterium]|nr:hypothetical protein [Xanthomonadales bacterium]